MQRQPVENQHTGDTAPEETEPDEQDEDDTNIVGGSGLGIYPISEHLDLG